MAFRVEQVDFSHLTAGNPDIPAAWQDLGIFLTTIKNVDGAAEALDKAARLAPSDLRIQNDQRAVLVLQEQWMK